MPTQIDGSTGVSKVQDGVIAQADLGPNVACNGPAFSARRVATQSGIASGTTTKVLLTNEDFDTSGAFDNGANSRFTPQVAGYYQINGEIYISGSAVTLASVLIQKNGVEASSAFWTVPAIGDHKLSTSVLVYLNGSTDYVELWGLAVGTIINFMSGSRMSGFLARAA